MNIFKCNVNLKSFTYPIVKIMVCVFLIIIIINSNRFVPIDNTKIFTEIILRLISVGCVLTSIFCIYISASEMILIHENRTKMDVVSEGIEKMSKKYSVEELASMVEKNDIIEVQIITDNNVVEIGSTSDCKVGSSKFFDKLYYVGKDEFADIDDFKTSLLAYSVDNEISVIMIDGFKPK